MERNMELIRMILLDVEKDNGEPRQPIELSYEGFDQKTISYHVKLLGEAGFLNYIDFSSLSGELFLPTSLTWEGHEFLDSIRNESVWKNIKIKLSDDLTSVPIKVLASVATEMTKEYFKNKLGLK